MRGTVGSTVSEIVADIGAVENCALNARPVRGRRSSNVRRPAMLLPSRIAVRRDLGSRLTNSAVGDRGGDRVAPAGLLAP